MLGSTVRPPQCHGASLLHTGVLSPCKETASHPIKAARRTTHAKAGWRKLSYRHTHLPCAVVAGTRGLLAPWAGEAGPVEERLSGQRALCSLRAPGMSHPGAEAI